MKEVWKDIKGYEGLYQVSNQGRVKSCERVITNSGKPQRLRDRILKPSKDRYGYLHVNIWKNGVRDTFTIHRLVAAAFIPNNDLFATTVNHIDEDKTNNRADNLEWLSSGDNTRYSHAGPNGCTAGSKHPLAKQVRCIETGQVFGSQTEACMWLGVYKTSVAVAIRQGSSCGGYHFEYINKDTLTAI